MAAQQFQLQLGSCRLKVVTLSNVELILEVNQSPGASSHALKTFEPRRQLVPQQACLRQMLLRSLTTTT